MRLWTLKPSLLDAPGLVALWREGLLAKAVIENKTFGYKNHPQLERFYCHPQPRIAINKYLWYVFEESKRRGFSFDGSKLHVSAMLQQVDPGRIVVTTGQVQYEAKWLVSKIATRAGVGSTAYNNLIMAINEKNAADIVSPSFVVIAGSIASWEKAREVA